MTDINNCPEPAADLRKRAEEISKEKAARSSENSAVLSPEETRQILHELRVHQIELEIQNEELLRSQAELYVSRTRYFDLYDLAPVGYCTLSEKGVILEANLTAANQLGVARGKLVKQPINRFILNEDQDIYYRLRKQLFKIGEPQSCELRMVKKDGTAFWMNLAATAAQDADGAAVCRAVMSDITERKFSEDERERMARLVLLTNTPGDFRECMAALTSSLQHWSGCEAVGIRLHSGDDYPYYETIGFPAAFVEAESRLCALGSDGKILRDGAGIPVIECMCGNVLCGRFDPVKPFFTAQGSFWTNSTTALLAGTSEADRQARTRNRCNGEGYESVALIPLRTGQQVFGLLQFNDHRQNRFTPGFIAHLERIADNLAISLSRRLSEEALRESESALREAQRVARIGSWHWNAVADVIWWSDELYRIYEKNLGSPPPKYEEDQKKYTPESAARLTAVVKKAMQTGEPYEIDLELNRTGPRQWVNARGEAMRDANRQIVGLRGTVQDITERKLAEEKIEAQAVILESIFNRASNILLIVNNEGRVEKINHKGVAFSGRKEIELLGLLGGEVFNCLNAFDGEGCGRNAVCSHCPVRSIVESTYRTGMPCNEKEGQMSFLIEGKETALNLIISTALVKSDGTDKVLLSLTDITKLRQAEAERIKLEAHLQQAQKLESIGTLAGGIAHDFNNILFPIIGLSEILMDDLPPGNLHYENAAEINKAGMRARGLVKQILSFSRQNKHEKMSVCIQHILKEVIKLTRATIPSNIEITQYLQSDCGLLMADPTQLHQIAMNLITNAYHAVEEGGGTISVRLKETELVSDDLLEPGKYAMLTVSDTGCGIDPSVINRIFEPYFTTKEQGKGTGLGLSVVHGIVKEHGGDISVVSEAGQGATFTVYLPLLKDAAQTEETDMSVIYETGTERILLVDDEKPIVRMEQMVLEKLGYHVTTFTSSLEALAVFKATPHAFHLIITDMTMPNMTGDKLAEELNLIRPGVPILICTGFSDKIDEKSAKAKGINGFLMKPVVKTEMAKMVRKVLDQGKGRGI